METMWTMTVTNRRVPDLDPLGGSADAFCIDLCGWFLVGLQPDSLETTWKSVLHSAVANKQQVQGKSWNITTLFFFYRTLETLCSTYESYFGTVLWFILLNIHWPVSSTLHLHISDIFWMREVPELKWAGVGGQSNYDNVRKVQKR